MVRLYEVWAVNGPPDTNQHIATYDNRKDAVDLLSRLRSSDEHEGGILVPTHRPPRVTSTYRYSRSFDNRLHLFVGIVLGLVLSFVLRRARGRPDDSR